MGAERSLFLILSLLSPAVLLTLSRSKGDDIDHLGVRRVRFMGEMLGQLRMGLARMKRNIQDRMSTIDPETTLPVQIINPRPLQTSAKIL